MSPTTELTWASAMRRVRFSWRVEMPGIIPPRPPSASQAGSKRRGADAGCLDRSWVQLASFSGADESVEYVGGGVERVQQQVRSAGRGGDRGVGGGEEGADRPG